MIAQNRKLKTGLLPESLRCATFQTYEEQREYYAKYRESRAERRRELNRNWILNNPERYKSSKWKYRDRIKREILTHYSTKDYPVCKRCGFLDVDCLVLDHINDDGARHRKEIGVNGRDAAIAKGGTRMYEAIHRLGEDNYPTDLQVLCANCNTKKQITKVQSHRKDNPYYANDNNTA